MWFALKTIDTPPILLMDSTVSDTPPSSLMDSTVSDAPPSSLMDSTASPKVKTTEGKGVGAHSLAHSISGVEVFARASGWD